MSLAVAQVLGLSNENRGLDDPDDILLCFREGFHMGGVHADPLLKTVLFTEAGPFIVGKASFQYNIGHARHRSSSC
jgi:hypothetical protein